MTSFYQNLSDWSHRAFYETNTKLFVVVNDFLSIVIVVSLISIIFESVKEFSYYHDLFVNIEYAAVIIFSIEYVLRVIGSKKKTSYIFSFFGLIDLISILPTYLRFINLTPLKSVRALRILRFLRILRLAKITHFEHLKKPSHKDTGAIVKLNLQIYFFALVFTVVILGNLAYVFEHNSPHFENIPLSMLWVFESLLGGSISTIVPQTYPGIIIFMIARLISFALLGFLVHIIGNIISHVLLGKKAPNTSNV